MGLLEDAVCAWESLCKISYTMVLGRKHTTATIDLHFDPVDLPHICGIHYASDVALRVNKHECYGGKMISVVRQGKITEEELKKSRNWSRIMGRLEAITKIEGIFDGEFQVAEFHPEHLPRNSRIVADYVIRGSSGQDIFFVFLDKEKGQYFCRSAFKYEDFNYFQNQPIMKPLKITKITPAGESVSYRRPNYRE